VHFFLDIDDKKIILRHKSTVVEQSGEFLDRSLRQVPRSRVTVALIFNVKREAMQEQTGSGLSPSSFELPSSLLPQINSNASPASVIPSQQVNDLYAEWDTMETIQAIWSALEVLHNVVMIEADAAAFEKLRVSQPDFAFNMAEGLYGPSREAQIPAILEMLQIPYLGSDPLTLAVCLDKARAKEILSYHKIPTAPFAVVRSMDDFEDARVRFPAMVKPLHEGSSKGIFNSCVVRTPDQLLNEVQSILTSYGQPALVEEYLPGREFTVAILGNGKKTRILPIVEIRFDALPPGVNPIYSYEAKWVWDTADNPLEIFDCPANLEPGLHAEIERTCLDAYRVLSCRDWARIDVRLDRRGVPNILEVNPLPGILPKPEDNSCFPKAARAAGMSYQQLIQTVLEIAFERCGLATSFAEGPSNESSRVGKDHALPVILEREPNA